MEQRDGIRAARDTDEVFSLRRKQCGEFLWGRQGHGGIVGPRRGLAMRDCGKWRAMAVAFCAWMEQDFGMSDAFSLHERLARGSVDLGVHGICRVLLKDQAYFPWVLLVPEVAAGVTELHQLAQEQYKAVCESIRVFSAGMAAWPGVEKVNVAAIGNQVAQLHIHIVGRHSGDAAWPGVVWSFGEKMAYDAGELEQHGARVRSWMESA